MATDNDMQYLQNELKKEAEAKIQPPKSEEKKVAEAPVKEEAEKEVDETTEEVVDETTKEVKDTLTVSERTQARMDALIERQIEKDKRIAELEKKLEAKSESAKTVDAKADPIYTKEQLLGLLSDPEQQKYHAWAYEKLAELKADERIGKFEKVAEHKSSIANSYEKAKEDFPEMADIELDASGNVIKASPMWKLANKIYIERGLHNDPDGQYIASALAKVQLDKMNAQNEVPDGILQKRLDREVGSKGLAKVARKSTVTSEDKLAKLEKEAMTTRAGSPQWTSYLMELERDRLENKRQNK